MSRNILALIFAGGNFGVSTAMALAVAFIPFAYEGIDPGVLDINGQPVIISLSAIDVNGIQVVPVLLAHSVAAAYFFLLVARDPSKVKMPRTTVNLFVLGFVAYSAITFNTFGLFFVPSAGLSILAAIAYSRLDFPEPEPTPPAPIARIGPAAKRRRRTGRRRKK